MVEVDPDRTVFELTEAHPELIELLAGLGFAGVRSAATRATMGRVITLRKGCVIQGKNLEVVASVLAASGFRLLRKAPEDAASAS